MSLICSRPSLVCKELFGGFIAVIALPRCALSRLLQRELRLPKRPSTQRSSSHLPMSRKAAQTRIQTTADSRSRRLSAE